MDLLSESADSKEHENVPLDESLKQKSSPQPQNLFASSDTPSPFGNNANPKPAPLFGSFPASDKTESGTKAEDSSFLSKEKVCVALVDLLVLLLLLLLMFCVSEFMCVT